MRGMEDRNLLEEWILRGALAEVAARWLNSYGYQATDKSRLRWRNKDTEVSLDADDDGRLSGYTIVKADRFGNVPPATLSR